MIAAYSMKRIAFNARTAEYKVLACILAVREYSNCKTKQNFLGVRITGYHKKKKKNIYSVLRTKSLLALLESLVFSGRRIMKGHILFSECYPKLNRTTRCKLITA